jgi:uncharacterized protein
MTILIAILSNSVESKIATFSESSLITRSQPPEIYIQKFNCSKMDKSSFLAHIGKIVAELNEVDVAYVFGSFLESDKFNDIDVALLLSEELDLDPYKCLKFSLKVAGELERQIKPRFEFDVKILNIAPVEFQFEVIRNGCTIFSRDESRRIDYEADVLSIYLDLKDMYDFLDKRIPSEGLK